MTPTPLKALALAGVVLLAAAWSGCGADGGKNRTIVLYAFSAMEDVMKEEVIPAFQKHWKEQTGEEVQIVTSFAGSGTITNQVRFGAPAQVAMVATEMDALNLREDGLLTTDWREFKNEGTYAYTIASIVTRQGNPKGLHSFEELGKEGVEVVYPDPTTSGGAQWAILALYGSALQRSGSASGPADEADARALLKAVSLNTDSLPESARRALTQFGLGYGDALLTYENEALLDIAKGKEYELVIPESTIYIEPKVVIVDKNVQENDEALMKAFVDFLWTEEAQEALARNHFRVRNEGVAERYANKYQAVELPFTVAYLGGWDTATDVIIDQVWREVQREIH